MYSRKFYLFFSLSQPVVLPVKHVSVEMCITDTKLDCFIETRLIYYPHLDDQPCPNTTKDRGLFNLSYVVIFVLVFLECLLKERRRNCHR